MWASFLSPILCFVGERKDTSPQFFQALIINFGTRKKRGERWNEGGGGLIGDNYLAILCLATYLPPFPRSFYLRGDEWG